ncbi:MAG: TlpA disulfide reductase family protein [Bacteroidota bacterium]|nr:TlpA disulfide reductase family protein [Bacteroidota bacterium]
MKKISVLVMAIGLLFSCQDDKGFYLSGKVDGMEDGQKVFISEIDMQSRGPKTVDTAIVKDGKFEIDMEEQEMPNLNFLRFEGRNGNVVFIAENERIDFDIDKDTIYNSVVSGGKENKALYEYFDHLKELNRKMMGMQQDMRKAMMSQDTAKLQELQEAQVALRDNDRVFKENIFEKYNDRFVGAMVLADMLNMKTHTNEEVREKFEQLSDEIKKTSLAQSIKEKLDNSSATDVGSKAPDFTAPDPEGNTVSLSENLGKITILDFWAAWCKPCRQESPNLVKTYNEFKDKGLEIVSVSLDRPGQKDKWVQAIEDDNLGAWTHVSNLQFWQDPVARKYDIKSIPATFVLDETGVIVAKNLRGEQLRRKIGELLK